MKRVLVLLVALSLVFASASLAAAQDATTEWSQYQGGPGHTGSVDMDLPLAGRVIGRTANVDAREGSQPVVYGDRCYVYCGVAGTSGSIRCFDIKNGKEVWAKNIEHVSSLDSWSSPAVSEGVVYIGSGAKVQALDADNGKLLWTKDLATIKPNAQIVNGSVAVDGNRLFIADFQNGCYYCLDVTRKGKLLWKFSLDAGSTAMSTPCIDGDRVFVGQGAAFQTNPKGKVWCIAKATGKAVSSWGSHGYYATADKIDVAGSVTAYSDFIYFTDFSYGAATSPNCHLYCLSKKTGKEAWKKKVFGSDGAPAVAEGLVVTAGQQPGAWPSPGTNWVTAFSADTGTGKNPALRWSKSGMGGYNMSACIANDKVAVGNTDQAFWPALGTDVRVLESSNGKTIWHSTEGGGPVVVTARGLLSIGGGKLVTFGPGPLEVANGDFYFAEGCTRAGYQEWICLQNATEKKVNAKITYMLDDGSNRDQPVELPAESRTTVDVNGFLGAGRDAAAHVTGDGPFVAERAMYVNNGVESGGEQVMGAGEKHKSFLFAEGTTRRGYQTWLALQNPSKQDTDAIITYYYTGKEPKAETVTIPATSRKTIDVNTDAGADADVSLAVTAKSDIVAERVMYFSATNPIRGLSPDGVHNSTGTDAAATEWSFAEGTTRSNFNEWLCLMNPGGENTNVKVRYLTFDRGVITRDKLVPANSRFTVNVNADVGAETDLSMQVTSDKPIVAERPMYFEYQPASLPGELWGGGHNVMGARSAAKNWEFAEGTTRPGFETYLCVSNPNAKDVEVTIQYITDLNGTKDKKTEKVTVAGNTRHTILINSVIGADRDVSFKVTAGAPIVVERSMYFSTGGYVGGGASLGFVETP